MAFSPSKDNSENETEQMHLAPVEPTSHPEAAVTRWCRKNRSCSGTAKMFFVMVDGGMPLFSTDEEAFAWLSESSGSDPSAATVLGLMYDEGLGVSQSYEEAVKWYRIAAEQGNTYAQCNLGQMYESGHGVELSYVEAVEWYRQAAEQDCVDVCWYRPRAEKGNPEAQYHLGYMCMKGIGMVQSYEKAAEWYRRAADQGHAKAQFYLGLMSAAPPGTP